MKLLILGNAHSIWVKEYIQYVLLPENKFDVYIVSKGDGGDFADFYSQSKVNIIRTDSYVPLIKNSGLKTVINLYKKVRAIAGKTGFDIIHVHYLPTNIMSRFYAKWIFKFSKRSVVSFWGSDLLAEQTEKVKKWQSICVNKCDRISMSGSMLLEKFNDIYGDSFDSKITIVKFGVSALSYIKDVQSEFSKEELKRKLGISKNKRLISVGYNAREEQQHIKVIEQLSKLEEHQKEQIALIFQFGTGLSSGKYKTEVVNMLEDTGMEYVLTEGFLDKYETAVLRSATDVFIHAQTTDALSASVQEYLYAGAYVINPKWIDYKDLKEIGVVYKEYNSFDELPEILSSIDYNAIDKEVSGNKQLLMEFASWEHYKDTWLKLYA